MSGSRFRANAPISESRYGAPELSMDGAAYKRRCGLAFCFDCDGRGVVARTGDVTEDDALVDRNTGSAGTPLRRDGSLTVT
jgi:hypothetical protein